LGNTFPAITPYGISLPPTNKKHFTQPRRLAKHLSVCIHKKASAVVTTHYITCTTLKINSTTSGTPLPFLPLSGYQ